MMLQVNHTVLNRVNTVLLFRDVITGVGECSTLINRLSYAAGDGQVSQMHETEKKHIQ